MVSTNVRVIVSAAAYSMTRHPTTPKSSSSACSAHAKPEPEGGVAWKDTVTLRSSTSSKPVSSYPTSSSELETVNHDSATTDATAKTTTLTQNARPRRGRAPRP
jgi:hypothetical protein